MAASDVVLVCWSASLMGLRIVDLLLVQEFR
jgi:hypothetical protein